MNRNLIIGIIVFALIGSVSAVLVTAYKSVPLEKQAGAYLYFTATRLKEHVEDAATARGSLRGLEPAMQVYTEGEEKFGKVVVMVHNNGLISAVNSKFRMHVTLVPTLVNGTVEWSCSFQPLEYGPPNCRTPGPSLPGPAKGGENEQLI
jgi:ethanolamine transporter EutH